MNPQELLNFLYTNNVSIDVDGEDLLIDAPENFLDDRLIERLGEHKLSIINMLRRFNKTTHTLELSKHDVIAPYSCTTTPAQDRILFLEEIAGNNSYYNIPFAYKISGAINKSALKKSFMLLIKNHEILRTTYIRSGIDYVQHINEEKDIDIHETDISYFGNKETKALELLEKDAHHKFLLDTEWPIRVKLIKLSNTEYTISINVHHIAADGLSAGRLINDINQAYNWFVNPSAEENFPNLGNNYQYSDYAIWQKKWLQSQDYIESKNYWINKLKGVPHLHSIPTDFLRPSNQSIVGDFYSIELPPSLGISLVVAAQLNKTTPFVIFQATFAALLSRYSSEKDILFGIASANRYPTAFINNIGLFVNTLALRYQLSNDLTFSALLAQAVEINNDALKHQSFPFDALVDHIQPQRDLSYNALIQIMLVMHDNAPNNLHLQGVEILPITQKQKVSKFDFSLHITPKHESFILEWEYNTDLFEHKTIEMFSTHFIRLLDALITTPDNEINKLPLVDKDEIPTTINRTLFPSEQCVHQLIEDKILSCPDAIAIIQGDEQFTYRELNESANKIAANLFANNKNIQRVGVCLHKSAEMIFSFFAILKMGAVYVPLDPSYPRERLEFMIKDSAVDVLITDDAFDFEFNIPLSILRTADLLRNAAPNLLPLTCNLESPAYIIYTSGSTGKPKGVLVSHKSLFYSLIANQSLMQIDNRDSMPTIGSQAFGVSLLEILLPLISGGTVLILQKSDILNIDLLTHLTDKVTVLHAVPSLMRIWLDLLIEKGGSHSYPNLRLLLVGGEAVPDKLLKDIKSWRPHVRLLELYGMTELAVVCSSYDMKEGSAINYCIGKPHPNTEFYVLNEQYQHQPIGIPGELHIGGLSLATEYINQPEITSEKFIVNPFDTTQRLYKSGDRVKRLANGHYEFLGRVDFQVSVRGVRIECGEIETLALQVEGVKQAIAHVFDTQKNDQVLTLYFTIISEDLDQTIIANSIRAHLNQYLPDYMCPSIIQKINTFPLNPNGKVDRKALPEPNISAQQTSYIAARTEIEERLCEIWQEALSAERVGITDNFFQLGGHSLSATRLVARINQAFKITLPLKTFFSAPTVEAVVLAISTLENNSINVALEKISREQVLLPSFAQQRLWVLDQIDGGSAHYNLPGGLMLSGHLNYSALTAAFNSIIERHESLRTCFTVGDDGQPIQIIQAARPFLITMTDLSALEEGARHLQKNERILAAARHVFDLSTDVMLRAELLKIAEDEHFLLVVMHHIASDGWSLSIFLNELCALYRAYSRGDANPLLPLSIQYADYAHWQRNWLQGEVLEQQLSYWTKQLSNLPVVHSLPLDRTRPNQQSFVGDIYKSQITNTTRSALNQLCQSQGATLFMGLHAAFSVLLSRYSNETDIVVGSPIANREQAGVAELIGFFVNTLVLRSDLSENPSFTTLLNQSKAMLLDAYAHQQVPFEQIVERLQPERNLGHSPLFQVMLVLQNNDEGTLDIPGLILSAAEQHVGIAKYDLTLYVSESLEGLKLNWEYNTDLFESQTIVRMANHFELLLNALIAKPSESVFKVEMLSAQERQQLLVDWNNTKTDYPNDKCIHDLFEAQVEKSQNSTAIVFENQSLSYRQLNEKANQLAHYLIEEKQVKPDTLVGICVERSLEMIIGILAILKAGGAYVPLDPEYPNTRLKYMLDDAKLTTVLTQSHLRHTTPVTNEQAICLDAENVQHRLQTHSITNPNSTQKIGLTSNNLAYVIYTSGSTGNPKGVMVEHNSVVNFLTGMRQKPGINESDCLLAVTSTSFDIHGLELFLPITVGAQFIVATKDATSNPDALVTLIKQHHVSLMQATPATWKMLIDANWPDNSPLKILCGGEALSLHLATALLRRPSVELWNMYGPTETTIWSTTQQVLPQSDQILMGQPIANTQIYIATNTMELAPIGVAGELLIGGAGVTRGYLNRTDLTAEKFIPNPFYDKTNSLSSGRLYKTGDLVRWLPDGNLEFLGRMDHQVKIRGFRIELGEIENTLRIYSVVKDVIVVAKESATTADNHLIAYVVAEAINVHDSSELATEARQEFIEHLRLHLTQSLPDYMVPSAFVLLESLPLTPNGKIDRNALPEPDLAQQQKIYVAPRTDIEQALCGMWHEILKINPIGITDNFFQLGGNSLLAARLVRKINLEIDDKFKISHIFQYPRIEECARFIEQQISTTPEIIAETFDPLTEYSIPVNRLFYKNKTLNVIAHHTGSIFLDIQSAAITFDLLQSAFSLLIEMHPILNSKQYINSAGNLVHTFRHTKEKFNITYKDFSIPSEQDICNNAWLNCDEYVATIPSNSFSFTEDDGLFKAYLFNCGETNPKRLFIIWHHNILDAFSIEIVMDDFDEILNSLLKNESYNTKKNYSNIIKWYDVISASAKNYWAQDLQYWKSRPWDQVVSLPHDKISDDFLDDTDWANKTELASMQCLWQEGIITAPLGECLAKAMSANSLSAEKTSILYSSKISQQGINAFDVILLAISRVFSVWTKNDITLLEIINSGRGLIFPDFDNTKTIGDIAFNAPLLINSTLDLPVLSSLRHIHDERQNLPRLALSYKWNKNILETPEYKNLPQSQILINYDTGNRYNLGSRFNLINNKLMTPSYVNSSYKDISQDLIAKDRVYIMADIKDGKLFFRVEISGYDGGVIYKNPYYHPSRIYTLSRDIIAELEKILNELHC